MSKAESEGGFMDEVIRVVIAEDQMVFREGLRSLLSVVNGIEVVGEAKTAQEALRLARVIQPEVMLLDLAWYNDESAGHSAIKHIKENVPHVGILAMTVYPHLIERARLAGAEMAVDKSMIDSPARLAELIQEVAGMGSFDVPQLQEIEQLNEREIDILRRLAAGQSDDAIASDLTLAVGTVKRYVGEVYGKLGAANRASAVAIGFQRGILKRGNSGF
jgi:two-component system response regulator DesR